MGFDGAGSHLKGQHRPHSKKGRVERFWVEDCKETKLRRSESDKKNETASDGRVLSFEVLNTRSDLVNDYHQIPRNSEETSDPTDESNKHDVVYLPKNPMNTSTDAINEKDETDKNSPRTEVVISTTSEEQRKKNDKRALSAEDSTQTKLSTMQLSHQSYH